MHVRGRKRLSATTAAGPTEDGTQPTNGREAMRMATDVRDSMLPERRNGRASYRFTLAQPRPHMRCTLAKHARSCIITKFGII